MANLLDAARARINAGVDYMILAVGDSTVLASLLYDGPLDSPYGHQKGGWPGRLGIGIGTELGCRVTYQIISPPGFGMVGGVAYPVDWTTTVTNWYTPPGGGSGKGVVRVVNSGSNAQTMQYHLTQMPHAGGHLMDDHGQSIIMVGHGINGTGLSGNWGTSDYITEMDDFVTQTKAALPGVPIIFTTQNPTGDQTTLAAEELSRIALYEALASNYVGADEHLPLTPALQVATKYDNVYIIDTRQAFVGKTGYMTDGLHPDAYGFQLEADFLLNQLGTSLGDPPTIDTGTVFGAMTVGTAFTQTITASGTAPITWSVRGTLPPGLSMTQSGDGCTIAGTPTLAGTFAFTLRALNKFDVASGDFTAVVAPLHEPFVPDSAAGWTQNLGGYYYPVQPKVRIGGTFKRFVSRS